MSDTGFGVVVHAVSNLPLDAGEHVQLFWACGKDAGNTCPVPVGMTGLCTFNHKISIKSARKAKEHKTLTLHFCLQQQVRFDVNRVLEKWALELGNTSGRLGVTSTKGITLTVELSPPITTPGSPRRLRQPTVDVAELERQMQEAQRQLQAERMRSQLLQEQLNSSGSAESDSSGGMDGFCRAATAPEENGPSKTLPVSLDHPGQPRSKSGKPKGSPGAPAAPAGSGPQPSGDPAAEDAKPSRRSSDSSSSTKTLPQTPLLPNNGSTVAGSDGPTFDGDRLYRQRRDQPALEAVPRGATAERPRALLSASRQPLGSTQRSRNTATSRPTTPQLGTASKPPFLHSASAPQLGTGTPESRSCVPECVIS
eukprot:EG_transcript_15993